jgi:hypothetical protein
MMIGGFLDGRQDDWMNRIAGSDKGRRLSTAKGKRFVHVGVHRTAATYLQRVVFPAYPQSEALFSDDVIGGKLFDNGLDNVARVREMVGDVTVILILRNQVSLLNSAYRTYVKAGGIWTYGRYADEIIARGKYDFEVLAARYFEVFGKENVHVLFYEDMTAEPNDFLAGLLSIIGVSDFKNHDNEAVNPGPTKYFNAGVRWLNILLRPFSSMAWALRLRSLLLRLGTGVDTHVVKKLARGGRAKRQWGHAAATVRIQAAYSDGNKRLAKMLGRDIAALGYY